MQTTDLCNSCERSYPANFDSAAGDPTAPGREYENCNGYHAVKHDEMGNVVECPRWKLYSID